MNELLLVAHFDDNYWRGQECLRQLAQSKNETFEFPYLL